MEGELIRTNPWLAPLAWIYGCLTSIRNLLFDWGILESRKYDIPIISVGNITVGGTGKTPHIEYLIRLLSPRYKVAVLSRGYKRKSKGYILATEDTPMEMIGDEPWQMAQKFPHAYIAVDASDMRETYTIGLYNVSTGARVSKLYTCSVESKSVTYYQDVNSDYRPVVIAMLKYSDAVKAIS